MAAYWQQERLFSGRILTETLEARRQELYDDIQRYDGRQFATATEEELTAFFLKKYAASVPILGEPVVDHREVMQGIHVTVTIQFSGDDFILRGRPANSSGHGPDAVIHEGSIILQFTHSGHDAGDLKKKVSGSLDSIKRNLQVAEEPVRVFNESLGPEILKRVRSRKQKLEKDKQMVEGLGFRLKRRPDQFVIPVTRKKPAIILPGSTTPEPYMENEAYEDILRTCSSMSLVMERSPKAFEELCEEDIRWLFLVSLNGIYEGQATGETFNFQGKTDILIRVNDRNIFIAECKFWKGPEYLRDGLDQLLGYTCWRDTKTALLVFNRERRLSTVLQNMPEVLSSHPGFVETLEYKSETGFRVKMRHRDDESRHVVVTVLVFEVPGGRQPPGAD